MQADIYNTLHTGDVTLGNVVGIDGTCDFATGFSHSSFPSFSSVFSPVDEYSRERRNQFSMLYKEVQKSPEDVSHNTGARNGALGLGLYHVPNDFVKDTPQL